jgi:hypothetical protein
MLAFRDVSDSVGTRVQSRSETSTPSTALASGNG